MGAGASQEEKGYDPTTTSKVKFRNGRPNVQGDEVIGCFSTCDESGAVIAAPGLLYRVIDRKKKRWYFYNDTLEYDMVVTGCFGPLASIKALGKAKMWREMPSTLLVVEVRVGPLKTEPFIEGIVTDGYDLRFRAEVSHVE